MPLIEQILNLIEKAHENGNTLSLYDTREIISASRSISNEPEVIDKLLYLITIYGKQEIKIKELTTRQLQILNLIGLGFKSKDISVMLAISTDTVSTHRKNIIKKLRLSGTRQLQIYALTFVLKKPEKSTKKTRI